MPRHPFDSFHPLRRLRIAALALALAHAGAQAATFEGPLERGPTHSVLWFVSPESGDLVGQVFANDSPAGRTILADCLPGLHCVVEGASAVEPPEDLTRQLHFDPSPSGWWLITQARSAHMQGSLPLHERELRTRYGQLRINEEHLLLLEGRPVLGNPQPASPPTAAAAPQPPQPGLWTRFTAWWDGLWRKLLARLGRESPAAAPASPAATNDKAAAPWHIPGTAEVVQGNSRLDLVAHYELDGQDVVLLQDTGGTGCPALFRFATLSPQGIAVTPEFGSCSDIASANLEKSPDGPPTPTVVMSGFLGPFEPAQAREQAFSKIQRFALRQGSVVELP